MSTTAMALRSGLTKLAVGIALTGSFGSFLYNSRAVYGPYASDNELASKVLSYLPAEVKTAMDTCTRRIKWIRSVRRPSVQEIVQEIKDLDLGEIALQAVVQVAVKSWNISCAALDGAYEVTLKIERIHDALEELFEQERMQSMATEILDQVKRNVKRAQQLKAQIEFEVNDVASDATQDAQYCLFHANKLAGELCQEVDLALELLRWMLHQAEQDAEQLADEMASQTEEYVYQLEKKIQVRHQEVMAMFREAAIMAREVAAEAKVTSIKLTADAIKITWKWHSDKSQAIASMPGKLKQRVIRAKTEVTSWPIYLEFVHDVKQVQADIAQSVVEYVTETVDSAKRAALDSAKEVGVDIEAVRDVVKVLPDAIKSVTEETKEIAADFAAERTQPEEIIAEVKATAQIGQAIAIALADEMVDKVETGHARIVKLTRQIITVVKNVAKFVQQYPSAFSDRLHQQAERIRYEAQKSHDYLLVELPRAADYVATETSNAVQKTTERVNQTVAVIPVLFDETAQAAADSPEMVQEAVTTIVKVAPYAVKNVADDAKQIAADLLKNAATVGLVRVKAKKAAVFIVKLSKDAARLAEKAALKVGQSAVKVAVAAVHEVAAPVVGGVTRVLSMPATLGTAFGDHVIATMEQGGSIAIVEIAEEEIALDDDSWQSDVASGSVDGDELLAVEVDDDPAINWPYSADIEEWQPNSTQDKWL